ncbi:MAG: nickel-binding protein [Desulfomonilaceae bacterium]
MPKYLTVHNETNVDKITLETRWTEICRDTRASWQMTLFNTAEGIRYCEWDAPHEDVLKEIFEQLGIKYSEIIEVDVTVPSEWRRRQMESAKGLSNCWEVMNCGRQTGGHRVDEMGVCPVAADLSHHGKNRGSFAGRYCWKVIGTLCGDKAQTEYAVKMRDCAKCKFFHQVKSEEGSQIVH